MARIKIAVWQMFWIVLMLGFTVHHAPCSEPNLQSLIPNPSALETSPQSPASTLLVFHSDWCGACLGMQPAVSTLVSDGYEIRRINFDEQPDLAAKYGVTQLPCFVVLERDKEIDRIVGVTTVERLKVKMRRNTKVREESETGKLRVPTPAWRYVQRVGHRSAIVRIYCQENSRTRSIGSGTLVRWNGRIVVLTARHVIASADRIVVELCSKKTHEARVLKADVVWDCAVLELTGAPEGVVPAEVEMGQDAALAEGIRLESCGYGSDGRLACNTGLFVGYRRPAEDGNGRDDWMVVTGHARQGDSGGGVFNARGRLVGVLWGTDGQSVVCVQAGRVHAVLNAACDAGAHDLEPKSMEAIVRNPTPPCEACDATAKKPLLPWRDDTQRRDDDQDARIKRLIELQERQATAAAKSPIKAGLAEEGENADAEKNGFSPILAGLCMLGSIAAGFVIYFAAQKN